MAGKMKGLYPASFQYATALRTMVAILAIPRLPTPMAIRPPFLGIELNSEEPSCFLTSVGRSAMLRSGRHWRTGSMRENMAEVYIPESKSCSWDVICHRAGTADERQENR